MSKRKILYISLLSILALTAVLALNDFTAPASGMATCSPDATFPMLTYMFLFSFSSQ